MKNPLSIFERSPRFPFFRKRMTQEEMFAELHEAIDRGEHVTIDFDVTVFGKKGSSLHLEWENGKEKVNSDAIDKS